MENFQRVMSVTYMFYPTGGISCLNLVEASGNGSVRTQHEANSSSASSVHHCVSQKKLLLHQIPFHEFTALYVLVFHELDKGSIDGLRVGGFQGSSF